MKKIIILLLTLLLSLSLFAGCKKKGESTSESTSAVVPSASTSESNVQSQPASQSEKEPESESQSQPAEPTLAQKLTDALSAQFNDASSVKIVVTSISEYASERYEYYWDDEAEEEAVGNFADAHIEESISTMYISFGDDGKIDAKIESVSTYTDLVSEDEYTYSSFSYIIDNVGYYYEEEIDAWVKDFDVAKNIEGIVSLINGVKNGEMVSNEELDALFTALGEAISVSFNLTDKSVELSVDASQTVKDFLAIFKGVDTSTKTVIGLLDDVLKLVDDGLSVEAILAKAEEVSALTVNQAIAEIDAWLTENYQTTLQEIYGDLVAREELVDVIIDSMSMNFETDEEREEFKTQIVSFNIANQIANMGIGDLTLFEVFKSMNGYPEELTATEFFTGIKDMLSVAIDEFEAIPAIRYMTYTFIEMAEEIQEIKVVANLGVSFTNSFAVNELSFGYKTETSYKGESDYCEGYYDTGSNKEEISFGISEISASPLSITLPEGANVVDIYIAGYYHNGNGELGIVNYGEDEVYLSLNTTHSLSGYSMELSAQIPVNALFSDTVTVAKEDVVIYLNNEATDMELAEDLVVKVDVESSWFDTLSNIDFPIAEETVKMAFDSILAGESTYKLGDDVPFTLLNLVSEHDSTYKIGLAEDSPASALTVICETDYTTGAMICTVKAVFVDYDKTGNLRNPETGSGWYGATYDENEILAYLGGDMTFVLELTEDGTIVCSDFVEFDSQYVKA